MSAAVRWRVEPSYDRGGPDSFTNQRSIPPLLRMRWALLSVNSGQDGWAVVVSLSRELVQTSERENWNS